MINTCALYGGGVNYSNWIGINLIMILLGFMVIALLYIITRFLTQSMRSKGAAVARTELVQLGITLIIIILLAGIATQVCSFSLNLSNALTGTSYSTFQFAESYTGNLAFTQGLNLVQDITALSISYNVYGTILPQIQSAIISNLPSLITTIKIGGGGSSITSPLSPGSGAASLSGEGVNNPEFRIGLTLNANADNVFYILSKIYIDIFDPIVSLSVGILFLQYLLLPFIQYFAFVVILPAALAVRAISFTLGPSLRQSANFFIAIAIAFYFVYPLTISMDAYIMHWIFSSANPALLNLSNAYLLNSATAPITIFSSNPTITQLSSGLSQYSLGPVSFLSSFYGSLFNPTNPTTGFIPAILFQSPITIVDQAAIFLFQAFFLFSLDMVITITFAISLSRGLNGGLGEAARFW